MTDLVVRAQGAARMNWFKVDHRLCDIARPG
jgi:hypothetical protein